MNDDPIPPKIEMLLARAEVYRGLAQVGAADLREGRFAMAAYFERMAREADQILTATPAAVAHPAPLRH